MVDVKICGINDTSSFNAAIKEGARYVGFVFFPPSPRNVTATFVTRLLSSMSTSIDAVALMVDPDDDLITRINAISGISHLQLHGAETPERLSDIKSYTGKRIVKAIKVSKADDLAVANDYVDVADILLFDAKTPSEMKNALPGGNAVSFDWKILKGRNWPVPWMLSGGLDAENVEEAIRVSSAPTVDVSSGVESTPGVKDSARISAFLRAVKDSG